MSKLLIFLFLGFMSVLLASGATHTQAAEHKTQLAVAMPKLPSPSPRIWLETVANSLLDKLDTRLDVLKTDPKALENFLYQNAMAVWDSHVMSRGLAGRYWSKSSRLMKSTLEIQWKWTLVRYFLKILPYYNGQRLHLEEKVNCLSPRRCWVRSTMKVAGKPAVNIDFYTHRTKNKKSTGAWKLIDIKVAGISLMKHKKGETRQLLRDKGIAGLIATLFDKNKKVLANLKNLPRAPAYAQTGSVNE